MNQRAVETKTNSHVNSNSLSLSLSLSLSYYRRNLSKNLLFWVFFTLPLTKKSNLLTDLIFCHKLEPHFRKNTVYTDLYTNINFKGAFS